MQRIQYYIDNPVNFGTEESPEIQHNLFLKSIPFSERNEELAKEEAYNGEYEIVEVEDPVVKPTQLDQIEAQVTYTALMTDTLLLYEEE